MNDAYSGEVAWTSLPIEEVDRVEVVKGAYSSLYGGEALGGVINILTRPITKREFEITGQYGAYNTANYSARYSERFFNRLGISLGYRRLQSGGYSSRVYSTSGTAAATGGPLVSGVIPSFNTTGSPVYLVAGGGANWYNQHAYRAKGEYTFSDATLFTLQYIRQDYGYGYNAYQSLLRDTSGNIVDRGTFLFNTDGTLRRLTVAPGNFLQVRATAIPIS